MDKIVLKNLVYSGIHGILAVEQKRKQPFKVEIEIFTDATPAANSDDIHDAVDYRSIKDIVQKTIEGPSCHLLEKLGVTIANEILLDKRIESCSVKICKTTIWDNGAPEVTITRKQPTR